MPVKYSAAGHHVKSRQVIRVTTASNNELMLSSASDTPYTYTSHAQYRLYMHQATAYTLYTRVSLPNNQISWM